MVAGFSEIICKRFKYGSIWSLLNCIRPTFTPRSMGLSSPWGGLPDFKHPVAWAYLARGVLNLIKPPATGQKPHFTAGGGAAWDGLPDSKHPVAWAYLARGVLYLIKSPRDGAKAPFYARGAVLLGMVFQTLSTP